MWPARCMNWWCMQYGLCEGLMLRGVLAAATKQSLVIGGPPPPACCNGKCPTGCVAWQGAAWRQAGGSEGLECCGAPHGQPTTTHHMAGCASGKQSSRSCFAWACPVSSALDGCRLLMARPSPPTTWRAVRAVSRADRVYDRQAEQRISVQGVLAVSCPPLT
jgi:hypothetical protein